MLKYKGGFWHKIWKFNKSYFIILTTNRRICSNHVSFCRRILSAKKSSAKSFIKGSCSCLSNGLAGSSGDLGITRSIFSFLSIIVAQSNLRI